VKGVDTVDLNLLFSIDYHFVNQLKTTLLSIAQNTKGCSINVYVLQKNTLEQSESLNDYCNKLGIHYFPIVIGEDALFENAPISKRYPETIYYRLIAHKYLPSHLDKVLYLDADILCINDLLPLYQMEISEYLYAACSHSNLTNMTNVINKVRLKSYESENYYNSGVLLMNLKRARAEVVPADIFKFIENNKFNLLLPDQDILNGLYAEFILALPDQLYNFDARKNATYETLSMGEWNSNWVVNHTVLLHFCGKGKPWQKQYRGRYGVLYKHYYHRMTSIS
jgi:lipopolysaccharide biosynthesis glycosyltransferase